MDATTSIELAPTIFDNYLISSFGLGSETAVLRVTALSIIFAEELMRLYAPMLFRGLSFILLCLPIPNIFGDSTDEYADFGDSNASSTSSQDAPIVPDEYVKFADDRKASLGNENDIEMLRKYGFDKYRHNSRGFLSRNGLRDGQVENGSDEEVEGGRGGMGGRGGRGGGSKASKVLEASKMLKRRKSERRSRG